MHLHAVQNHQTYQNSINQYENIVLIAGGIKNQEDYSALFELIDNHIPHVVLIGQSAKELGNNIHTAKPCPSRAKAGFKKSPSG
jgi:UDP-N-acetylmuramoylalanine-D-glutamate ligase